MDEWISRTISELAGRVGGPMSFRFLLQPATAAFFAWRAGWKDARTGRPPYFWAMLTDPSHRLYLLRDGWKDVAKVFVFALVLDTVYQFIQLRWVYPMQALIVAFGLAFVPYVVLRGPFRRIAGWWSRR
jgi:hypothetical protein